eukprot:TRINITY_DN8502_c0_g1_i1.p1 TRINITY_DN8502_c0_g1~~TRINITY_DN8502_c0_g1_i1.p1  ORF type:complete len:206 (+),score=84.76 TRINITY_DN8502_c0_g1_i1:92-709(+)
MDDEVDADTLEEERQYLEKVSRTVFIDNISPGAKDSVVQAGVEQFGNVRSLTRMDVAEAVGAGHMLVDMMSAEEAQQFVIQLEERLFMLGGLPRPARASMAVEEMMERKNPTRQPLRLIAVGKTEMDEVGSSSSKARIAKLWYRLLIRQHEEKKLLHKVQQEEMERLAKQQEELMKRHVQRLEMLESVGDTASKLLLQLQQPDRP